MSKTTPKPGRTAIDVRARGDRELAEKLLADRHVARVVERIERAEEDGPMGVRRQLLGTSVRLTRGMAPALHSMTDDCRERLGVEIPLELYVFSSPTLNAACVKPEAGRLFIMLSSELLEKFEAAELAFVMGHELGHFLYDHHDIPIGQVLRGETSAPPSLALQLFAWSRYAEISADRAGALCAGDLEAEARALFKLASGLTANVIDFRLKDFLAQVDEMQIEGDGASAKDGPRQDWFSTHPFSPLRVRALKLFSDAELSGRGSHPVEWLEGQIQHVMALMEPSYLQDKSPAAETMRRLLFAAAICVSDAWGGITDTEVEVFEGFFGADSFSERLDLERIKAELEVRLAAARETATHPQCIQIMRDLCLVARADGDVAEEERAVLDQVAAGLGVDPTIIDQTLAADVELD